MAGNMFVYDNTEPTRQILAEEAEPAHSCRAFRGLDLFVVLYVVGVIPMTRPSFRAVTSSLTTGIIPKTSIHNNRSASYLFTLPMLIGRPSTPFSRPWSGYRWVKSMTASWANAPNCS